MIPTISLSFCADFLNAQGIARGRLVQQQRRQREQLSDRHWAHYYQPVIDALIAYVNNGCTGPELDNVVASAPTKHENSFARVTGNLLEMLRRRPPVKLETAPKAVWSSRGGVQIRVAPHVMATFADGRREAWYLHFKRPALARVTSNVLLYLVSCAYATIEENAAPIVVNVSTAKFVRELAKRQDDLMARFLEVETESYKRYWEMTEVA
jgi:hypothetical protein